MHSLRKILALVAVAVCRAAAGADAQETIRIFADSPGPGYREIAAQAAEAAQPGSASAPQPVLTDEFREALAKNRGAASTPQAVLSYQQRDIRAARLVPAEDGMSQIELTFQPQAVAQIKDYIEFNKAKPIRMEIGDYTLPLDMGKTLPWTGAVWLEARPTEKVRTILGTLKQVNGGNP